MKRKKKELLLFVCTVYTVLLKNESRKQELGLTEAEEKRLAELLAQPETARGIMVLYQAMSAALSPAKRSLQQTAENYPLEYLGLSARPYACLAKSLLYGEIRTVADLLRLSEAQISRIRGIGPNSKSQEEIKRKRLKFVQDYHAGLIR